MTGQLKMRQLSTATVTWLQMFTVSCFYPRRIESGSADKRTFKVFHSEQSHSTDAFLSRRLPAFRCPCVRLSVCPLVWGSSNDLATFLARKSMLTNSKCFFLSPRGSSIAKMDRHLKVFFEMLRNNILTFPHLSVFKFGIPIDTSVNRETLFSNKSCSAQNDLSLQHLERWE